MWSSEDVLDLNGPQPGQSRSKLARVIDQGGILPEALAIASNEVEQRVPNHVAAFFQLPFPVDIDDDWITVPGTASYAGRVQLRFLPCKLEFDDFSKISLRRIERAEKTHGAFISQGILLVPVWGVRANHHDRYLEHADSDDGQNPIIVPQKLSWIENRPIFKGPYAHNFANRLIREVKAALSHFIPAYGIVSLSTSFVPEEVMGFCAMISPGRVTFAGDFVTCVKGILNRHVQLEQSEPASTKRIEEVVRFGPRVPSDFENQVLAIERLRRSGETALTLVAGCSLLEWLIKQHIAQRGIKPPQNFAQLLDHEAMDLASGDEISFLHLIRKARNAIAHEAIPERHSHSAIGPYAGKEIEGVKTSISQMEARKFLLLVFELFRRHNLRSSRGVSGA